MGWARIGLDNLKDKMTEAGRGWDPEKGQHPSLRSCNTWLSAWNSADVGKVLYQLTSR